MLKTALKCISVLLVAANVCYGHGTCQSFHGQYFEIKHFAIAADGTNRTGPVDWAHPTANTSKLHRTTVAI